MCLVECDCLRLKRKDAIVDCPDFKELDMQHIWKHKTDKYAYAQKYGFTYISEAVWHFYYNCEYDTSEIGFMFDVTYNGITMLMKKWGWKRRHRGGNRIHPNSIYPHLQFVYNNFSLWKGQYKDFYKYISEILGISEFTVEYFCLGRTYPNFTRVFKQLPGNYTYPTTYPEYLGNKKLCMY